VAGQGAAGLGWRLGMQTVLTKSIATIANLPGISRALGVRVRGSGGPRCRGSAWRRGVRRGSPSSSRDNKSERCPPRSR